MKLITSPQNVRIKHLAKLLSQAKARREYGQTVLEGVHLAQAFLQSGKQAVHVYIPESKQDAAEIAELAAFLPEDGITLVSDGILSKITSLTESDDVMLLIDIPPQKVWPVSGDCAVLDRVRDPGNAGTILRTLAAAGIGRLVAGCGCVDIWSPKVLRSAMGAHFLLEIYTDVDLVRWLDSYRDRVLATALGGNSQVLYELDLRQPAAWIFGNEGGGIAKEILDKADKCVGIPMAGETESLNVAMAAAVCLFEQMRQRQYAQAV